MFPIHHEQALIIDRIRRGELLLAAEQERLARTAVADRRLRLPSLSLRRLRLAWPRLGLGHRGPDAVAG